MTSLIDVIFLLLLFFMLSSTFSRFVELDLSAAGAGGAPSEERPVFLSLFADSLLLNGQARGLEDLADALTSHRREAARLTVLVSLKGEVTAQRLTDLLGALRGLPDLDVRILEAA